jgi:beta-lactamase superfamily II metal-dependent hydrolase
MRCLSLLLLCGVVSAAAGRKTLEMIFVDTEGGQATVLAMPSGESMLIDAGFPGHGGRDARRIVAAARQLGLSRIDYVLVTHYHLDHVGGVPEFAALFPIGAVIDHGENTETTPQARKLEDAYRAVIASGVKRLNVKPGDVLPLKDVRAEVVAARGNCILRAVKGGGRKNPLCGEEQRKADDPTENARSIGIVLTFGKFRFVDLADLTWNKELELACPEHKIGPVDLYLTTHHGMDSSGPKAIVHGMRPLVAIMNNGARKGGSPAAWSIISSSPGLRDLWQLHFSLAGGQTHNAGPERIANLEEKCEGHSIGVSVEKSGAFRVTNSRNGHSKTYKR